MLGRSLRLTVATAALALVPSSRHVFVSVPAPVAIDSTVLSAYRWRNVGPDRGGRSIAASGVHGRPKEAYFGATGGGLWKTTDGGASWAPVTDGKITSASVGAVAVSESNPDVVYIGMGESCIRGNIMSGDGVYRSIDAGKTWTHVGFSSSDAISKIRIHPTNPNVVFVASFGKYGVPSEERGVFKSSDGGKTWKRVLFRDAKTGAIDLSIDPTNPNVMYAALWEAYRTEWQMSSGGAGSGLFKSTDGGETWTEITRNPGLPNGTIGRIGVAVSPANPKRVFALVENAQGGLFRSEDAGATWALVNGDRNIRQRAFYYTHVTADPKNADLVFLLNVSAYRSTDGGKTLQPLGGARNPATESTIGSTHGDNHELWVDADDPQHMMLANDGGGAMSYDGGRTWSAETYPTAQFYHVATTAHVPFHMCGSQQDSNEQCVPYTVPAGTGGVGRRGQPAAEVYSPGGSEDGYIAPDPLHPDVFYSGTNANGGGFLTKLDRRTGQTREVSPYPRMFSGEESAVIKERWQWTYPVAFSPVNPRVLYAGSQHLWKTTNGGDSWTRMSPDLTRHDPKTLGPSGGPITRDMNGPEVYAVIFALAPSKRTERVVWTGSDDGLVHVTRDGGASWTNVTPKEMPDFGRVSIIDASAFDSATAYVAVKRPLLDDKAPYVFRTHDFGKTWTKITTGLGPSDYVHVVREDPTRKGMLYAGTQHGVYLSYDDGDHWMPFSLNLPDVPVVDLAVEDNALAIATHGRSFYVLDDIAALRQYDATLATTTDPVLFTPARATRSAGPASVKYWLKSPAQRVTVEILDAQGRVLRTFAPDTARRGPNDSTRADSAAAGSGRRGGGPSPAPSLKAGLNTVSWDLRVEPATSFPGMVLWGGSTTGPMVPPGTYTVRLTTDPSPNGSGQAARIVKTVPIVVRRNPTYAGTTDADLRTQYALAIQLRDKVSEANNAVIQIRDLKTQIADRVKKSTDAPLKTKADTLAAHLSAIEEDVYQVRNQSGQDPLNFPIKINNRIASLLGVVAGSEDKPIASVYPIFTDLKAELKVQTDRLHRLLATELTPFNLELKRVGLEAIAAKGAVLQ